MADGVDEESAYAARMDTWIAWETEDTGEVEMSTPPGCRLAVLVDLFTCAFPFLFTFVGASPGPVDLRTAHLRRVVDSLFSFVCVAFGTYHLGITRFVYETIQFNSIHSIVEIGLRTDDILDLHR
jgi:hypothetical protein